MCALYQRNVRERPCKNFVTQSDDLFSPTATSQSGGHRQAKTRRKNHLLFAEKPQNRKRVACRRGLSRFVKRTIVFQTILMQCSLTFYCQNKTSIFQNDKIACLSIDFKLIKYLLCKLLLIYIIKNTRLSPYCHEQTFLKKAAVHILRRRFYLILLQ